MYTNVHSSFIYHCPNWKQATVFQQWSKKLWWTIHTMNYDSSTQGLHKVGWKSKELCIFDIALQLWKMIPLVETGRRVHKTSLYIFLSNFLWTYNCFKIKVKNKQCRTPSLCSLSVFLYLRQQWRAPMVLRALQIRPPVFEPGVNPDLDECALRTLNLCSISQLDDVTTQLQAL